MCLHSRRHNCAHCSRLVWLLAPNEDARIQIGRIGCALEPLIKAQLQRRRRRRRPISGLRRAPHKYVVWGAARPRPVYQITRSLRLGSARIGSDLRRAQVGRISLCIGLALHKQFSSSTRRCNQFGAAPLVVGWALPPQSSKSVPANQLRRRLRANTCGSRALVCSFRTALARAPNTRRSTCARAAEVRFKLDALFICPFCAPLQRTQERKR